MLWVDQARILLGKAREDAVIVSKGLADADIADAIVGFHTQQAGEKAMKAVLCMRTVSYRFTHDLQELADLLTNDGLTPPQDVIDLVNWSPFAVVFRYEDLRQPAPVDRALADNLVKATLHWA